MFIRAIIISCWPVLPLCVNIIPPRIDSIASPMGLCDFENILSKWSHCPSRVAEVLPSLTSVHCISSGHRRIAFRVSIGETLKGIKRNAESRPVILTFTHTLACLLCH